ncbi:PDZ domain-containing protein [Anaerobacillus sp. HL2]|nr:PDZ domain-containing protein [Anaerobacillus sp. HL2]
MESGQVNRPYIGVGLTDFDEIPAFSFERYGVDIEQGVIISECCPDSPAARAHLQVEDIITAMNGVNVSNSGNFRKLLVFGSNGRGRDNINHLPKW